jgi:hypothetical protein
MTAGQGIAVPETRRKLDTFKEKPKESRLRKRKGKTIVKEGKFE